MNLNTPSIDPGPLTAADLDCKTNTGRIYHLHRATLAPAGCDNQGRTEARQWPGTDQPMAAEACNETDDDSGPTAQPPRASGRATCWCCWWPAPAA